VEENRRGAEATTKDTKCVNSAEFRPGDSELLESVAGQIAPLLEPGQTTLRDVTFNLATAP